MVGAMFEGVVRSSGDGVVQVTDACMPRHRAYHVNARRWSWHTCGDIGQSDSSRASRWLCIDMSEVRLCTVQLCTALAVVVRAPVR